MYKSSNGMSRRIYSWFAIGLAFCALTISGNALPAQAQQAQNQPKADMSDSLGRPHPQKVSPDHPMTSKGKEPDAQKPDPQKPDPEKPDPEKIDMAKLSLLDQARYHSEEFMNDLPNFVVTKIITRYTQMNGEKDWNPKDKSEIELSYSANTGERNNMLRYNDMPTKLSYDEYKSRGAYFTGDFGLILRDLFATTSQTEFKEVRREIFHKRQCVLYEFKIKKANSNYTLTAGHGNDVKVGLSGNVWIDMERGCVLRIEESAEDIPQGFAYTMNKLAIEYDWLDIDCQKLLLPVFTEMILGNDSNHAFMRNVTDLHNYHRFETDVKILLEK